MLLSGTGKVEGKVFRQTVSFLFDEVPHPADLIASFFSFGGNVSVRHV